jgi:hypothetical protein
MFGFLVRRATKISYIKTNFISRDWTKMHHKQGHVIRELRTRVLKILTIGRNKYN